MNLKFMKTNTSQARFNFGRCAALSLLLMAGSGLSALAADVNPPERLTYQSYLVDGNGNALGASAPKNYDVIFRIYDAQSGGNLKWSEQQTVTVDKGYFSVLLGEGSQVGSEAHPTLSGVFGGADASDRFVQITVKGIGPSNGDVDILPRLQMLASPYSFLARNAVNAANLANSANSQIVTVSGNNVGINKAIPGVALDVVGAGSLSGNATINNAFIGDVGYGANFAGFAHKNSPLPNGYALLQKDNGQNTILNAKTGAGASIDFRFDNSNKMSLDPGGNLALNGSIGIGSSGMPSGIGAVNTAGPNAGFSFGDRTGNGQSWSWYANQGSVRLWNSSGGDRFKIDLASGIIGIYGTSPIEFGVGMPKADSNNGKIGYQTFDDALDIVGAGNGFRKVNVHSQDGFTVFGNYYSSGSVALSGGGYYDVSGNGGGYYFSERNNGGSRYCMYGHDGLMTIWSSVSGRDIVQINAGGYMGINRNPRCPMDVGSYGNVYGVGGYGYVNYDGGGADHSYHGFYLPYSILADQRVGAAEFNAFSDKRIKNVVGASDNRKDLDLIKQLKVTDYRMVDVVQDGTDVRKGFIAQEVEKLIPEAVTKSTNFIPNIYCLAKSSSFEESTKTLTLTMTNALNLKKGVRLRVITEAGSFDGAVEEIVNPTKFRLNIDTKEVPKKVFVFGTEVDDFRSLNYDRIFTTGISAIQELAKQSTANETRITELEAKSARAEKELSELKQLVSKIAAQQEKRAAALPATNPANN